MGADRTLVEGAYRAAMAKVPGDYSKFYWQQAMSGVQATKSILEAGQSGMEYLMGKLEALNEETRVREKLRKKADNEQFNKFETAADAAGIKFGSYERGGNQEMFHKKIFDLYLEQSDELKKAYKLVNTTGDDDTPENKKQRMIIWGELQAGVNELKTLTTEVLTIGTLNKGKQISKEGMNGTRTMYNYEQIINQDGDWANVTVERTKEEGLVFVIDPSGYVDPLTGKPGVNEDGSAWGKERVAAKNFMKNLIPKAHGQLKWWLKDNGENEEIVLKNAKNNKKHSKFNFGDKKEGIKNNMFTDEKAYVDLVNRAVIKMEDGPSKSVRDIWFENPELQTATYGSLGVALAQQVGNKDNFITEADFVLPKDRQKIADALFRPTLSDGTPNPNFSWDAGTDVASDILAQIQNKRYDDLVSENPIVDDPDNKTTYKNKKHEWRIETTDKKTNKSKTIKGEIWSDDIINHQNELMTLGSRQSNSFKSDQTVLIAGQHYGYWRGSGFARVNKNDKGDVSREQKGGIPTGGWFKTIADVLKDAGLPTTYLQYTNTASTGKSRLPGWNK